MNLTGKQIHQLSLKMQKQFQKVLFAYLFGSAVKGTATRQSDIDIAVYLEPGSKTPEVLAGLTGLVEEVFPGVRCDLITLADAGSLIAFEAIKGTLLFVREQAQNVYSEFYAQTCIQAEDQREWMKKQLKYRGYEVQWSY
jgi:predicted nucleotidyltransferase